MASRAAITSICSCDGRGQILKVAARTLSCSMLALLRKLIAGRTGDCLCTFSLRLATLCAPAPLSRPLRLGASAPGAEEESSMRQSIAACSPVWEDGGIEVWPSLRSVSAGHPAPGAATLVGHRLDWTGPNVRSAGDVGVSSSGPGIGTPRICLPKAMHEIFDRLCSREKNKGPTAALAVTGVRLQLVVAKERGEEVFAAACCGQGERRGGV